MVDAEPGSKPLRGRREPFAVAVALGIPAAKAYADAGYNGSKQNARRLKEEVAVSARIDYLLRQRTQTAQRLVADQGISVAEVVKEFGRLGFSDIRGAMDDQGRLLPLQFWPHDLARAVAGVDVVTKRLPGAKRDEAAEVEYITKIRLWDKTAALNSLAKHLGMFIEAMQVNHTHQLDQEFAEIFKSVVTAEAAMPVSSPAPAAPLKLVHNAPAPTKPVAPSAGGTSLLRQKG